MIGPLYHDQFIVDQILVSHIPRLFVKTCNATDSQPLSLTDSMIHQSTMFAEGNAVFCFDQARLRGQVLFKEVFDPSFANKADTGTVFFTMSDQIVLLREAADLRLCQIANREKGLREVS